MPGCAKYEIGQVIHIVDFPMDGSVVGTKECDAGWADEMTGFCGQEAIIIGRAALSDRYDIDIDGGKFWWSSDCFKETYGPVADDTYPDDEEIDLAMEHLLDGFA